MISRLWAASSSSLQGFARHVLQTLFQLYSPSGAKGRLQVLIFHRVLARPDPLFPSEVDAVQFEAICAWLRTWFQVLPLDRAMDLLSRDALPARALAITFDDGYADNHEVALPILQRHGLCATFYIATGFLDGGRMWNDAVIESIRDCAVQQIDLQGTPAAALGILELGPREDMAQRRNAIERAIGAAKYLDPGERLDWVAALVERSGVELGSGPMMRTDQVRGLHAAGMQIGAHTVSHPILARLPRQQAEREIADSKHALEGMLGAPVTQFAYPNGKPGQDYSPESVELVRRVGFAGAVSTAWGAARRGADLFELPRFTPWDRTKLRFAGRLVSNLRS